MEAVLYVHGRGGSAGEAEHYRQLFPGTDVIGLDYRGAEPWTAGPEIMAAVRKAKDRYGSVTLIAVSIGAFFSMCAGVSGMLRKAYLISPVTDMDGLIRAMMAAEGITEAELREKGRIHTGSGEDLSWEYLSYVREHPAEWDVPTEILYGNRDSLVPFGSVSGFAEEHGCGLTVMENGEHWFHTGEQMRFLDAWITEKEKERGRILTTPRLVLKRLRDADRDAFIRMASDPRVKMTYMLPDLEGREQEDAFFGRLQAMSEDGGRFVYGIYLEGELIGFLNECETEGDSVEVGYFISPEHWGLGYAPEALKAAVEELFRMGYERVTAGYFEENPASRRVMEKCGMRPLPEETDITYRGAVHRCRYYGIERGGDPERA